MQRLGVDAVLREKYAALAPMLDERRRRLWAAAEAQAVGRGGQTLLTKVTGLARSTLYRGQQELTQRSDRAAPGAPRVRAPGGGRKPLTDHQPLLPQALEALVEPTSRGDPQSPRRWPCKSVGCLAAELQGQGYRIGRQKVAERRHKLGDSLQANRQTKEGAAQPDRTAQFEYINAQVQECQDRGPPVVSVDTKKKELSGEVKAGGREWSPHGEPTNVLVHDGADPALGKAIPDGVYDLTANSGWVSSGIAHDTTEFAVETLRRWWRYRGAPLYPQATTLLLTAEGGGSNGRRRRLGKVALQRLAAELGRGITVCHFP